MKNLLVVAALCMMAFFLFQSANAQSIIFNEVLADPSTDVTLGDSNGDGVRNSAEDEFVELANVGTDTVDMTGWRLGDDEAGGNFQFPDGYMMAPNQIVVVFGGGDVSNAPGYDPDPLLTRAFSADSTLGNGLANGGDYVILLSPDSTADSYFAYNSKNGAGPPTADVVAGYVWEYEVNTAAVANNDNSVTRFPDGDTRVEDPFVEHLSVSANPFSPGQTVDGYDTIQPIPIQPGGLSIIFNEVLADPSTDLSLGDSNGDGVRNSAEDEFVELANIGTETVDMTGWRLGDDETGGNFQFPDGYMMAPNQIVVIFGGGDVSNAPGYDPDPLLTRAFSADSSIGNGLANGGDYVLLLSPDGTMDSYFAYNSKNGAGPPTAEIVAGITWEYEVNTAAVANNDNSVTRYPDGDISVPDPFVEHLTVSPNPFSPGQTVEGSDVLVPVQPTPTLSIIFNEVLADPAGDVATGDANNDGVRSSSGDEFVELANISDDTVDVSGWRLGDDEYGGNFVFPDGYKMAPNQIVVIFGGPEIVNAHGYDPDPLKTRVFTADSTLGNGLANGGDYAVLLSPDGSYDMYFAYGSKNNAGPPMPDSLNRNGLEGVEWEFAVNTAAPGNQDNSMTRFPDGEVEVEDPFVLHLSVSDQPFSPAQTVFGDDVITPYVPPAEQTIVVNEVLADPATTVENGDANGDGERGAQDDEFVELVNVTNDPIDIGGWQLGDDEKINFTFPVGYTMQPKQIIAIFGGGDVSNVPGYDADSLKTRVFTTADSIGNGLANGGDYFVLLSDDGEYDMYVAYGSKYNVGPPTVEFLQGVTWEWEINIAEAANQDNSVTRNPDGNIEAEDTFVQHLSVSSRPFSPAQTIDGANWLGGVPEREHPWGSGYAVHFNWWEHDRIEVREAAQLFPYRLDAGTIEMWFKPDSIIADDTHPPDWTYLFSKNVGGNVIGDMGLAWPRGDGRIEFFIQDGQATQQIHSQSERLGSVFWPTWYHIACTWDVNDSMRMFINGKLVGEIEPDEPEEVNLPLFGGEQMFAIGCGAINLFEQRFETFRGTIDEVRFSMIPRYTEDFELATAPFEPDQYTLALWHFDEGEGDITEDATGNGFTGYLGGKGEGVDSIATRPSWVSMAPTGVNDTPAAVPERFALEQNYPNPFNPSTTIEFNIDKRSHVSLKIFNVVGQTVETLVDKKLEAGGHKVVFDAKHLATGVYFYVLDTKDKHLVKKMVLVK